MIPFICPLCGGNTREHAVSEEFTAAIEKAGGVASDTEEPGGGRALVFGNGKRVRIHNWCNVCDVEDILAALGRE